VPEECAFRSISRSHKITLPCHKEPLRWTGHDSDKPAEVELAERKGETIVANAVPRPLERASESILREARGARDCSRHGDELSSGFTVVELLIVVGIILTVATIALPQLMSAIDQARYARAVSDIRTLQDAITADQAINGVYTDSLASLGYGSLLDPWGHPYQYLNHATMKGNGKARKDRFLVPLNSDYDLYSMGKDGKSSPPITSKSGLDDIIRANDGSYIGLASLY
jgi:general secretion pathway protein G